MRIVGWPLRMFPHLHTWLGAQVFRFVSRGRDDEFHNARGRSKNFDLDRMTGQFETSLEQFIGVAKRAGLNVVLMTQQNRMEAEPRDALQRRSAEHFEKQGIPWEHVFAGYAAFNETIRKTAIRHQLPLVDLDARIAKTSEFMYDMVHANDRGSIAIAEAIAEELEPLLPKWAAHR
ncbi:MAG: hypothetical protein NZ740_03760 [Kiritimatiellae bacterium]|nr:hypothetical protein [Kiritimatiellia bacterium]MDW8458205.1 hypothetical protein [Verrucomicrobiota bacterium]